MKVNGKDYPIYYGKYKMFETTNQSFISFIYGSPCPIFRQTELASCPLFPAAVMAHLRTHKWTLRAPDTKDFVVLGPRKRTRDGESIENSWIYGIQMEKNMENLGHIRIFLIYDDSKWSTWDNFTVCYGNCDVQKRHIIARGYLSHQPAFFVQPIFRNPQNIWLVVEPPLLKNMKVTWDDYSQYIMEK